MPLIEYPAGTATVHMASWLWMNRESLGTAWTKVSDAVMTSLAAPRAEIHRLGSTIISVHDDQTRVLGVLHEHTARLDGIDVAVGGLASGQAALGHSLGVLQNLSMLTLGISAASSLILFRQFLALRAQLARLERTTHRIGVLVEAQQLGQLETGLNQLRDGMDDIQSGRTDQGPASATLLRIICP
jgi:X-X-X-Leu-X-X-Gly heptad repeat protein